MGKYEPLYNHLAANNSLTVTMTFSEAEAVLGFALPASAREHAAWWANADPGTGQHPYSQAWMRAGRRAVLN
ncbi:MAG: DUF7662 domain-containing protein [Terriglobales bacterium]